MPGPAKKISVIVVYLALILCTLLVFWQVTNSGFINYDDGQYVYANPHVLGGLSRDGVIWAFKASHSSNWHPVTWLSHMLDCQLFGPRPGRMHLVNLLLHIANTLLLFAVLKGMTGALWRSAFVAVAFAMHPMHVESVAWIAERKDVLSTLFLLLTLAAYAGYVKSPSAFRYVGTLALFACGLMTKPMLVTLPFLLLLLDYWPLSRFDARYRYRIIVEKIPFFVLAAISSVITFLVQRSSGAVVDIDALPLPVRAANAFLSYARYIGKMFWPRKLAVFYPFDADSFALWQVAICVVLLLGITILVIRFGRGRKYLPVGWFWFVGMLVPVVGFVQVGIQAFADRYTYIPYIGLFIMIAWGLPELLSRWPQRNIALGIAATIAITAMGALTYRQTAYWNDSIALFSHAIEVTRDNHVAHSNRATAYGELGLDAEAISDFMEAIRIKPDYADAYYNLGIAYGRLGRWQEAIDAHTPAIEIRPDHAEAINNRGIAYGRLGRWHEAIDAHKQAIKLKPDYIDAYNDLAIAYDGLGRGTEAIEVYRQVIRLKPDYAEAHNNLAWLIAINTRIENRDTNEAIRLARGACELADYRNPAFLGTLAAAYASAGRFSEAVDTANRALSLADAANQPQLRSIIQHHLSFYTQGLPYIEPGPEPSSDASKP